MTVFNSHSTADTEGFAEKIGKVVTPGTCIAFFGGLGMGKTAFTRGLAKGMGIDCHVSSPTFALVNDYGGSPQLVHFDMYKVESWDDLYSSGFFDYYDLGAIIVTEWSENIEFALPEEYLKAEIYRTGNADNERSIKITLVKSI